MFIVSVPIIDLRDSERNSYPGVGFRPSMSRNHLPKSASRLTRSSTCFIWAAGKATYQSLPNPGISISFRVPYKIINQDKNWSFMIKLVAPTRLALPKVHFRCHNPGQQHDE